MIGGLQDESKTKENCIADERLLTKHTQMISITIISLEIIYFVKYNNLSRELNYSNEYDATS